MKPNYRIWTLLGGLAVAMIGVAAATLSPAPRAHAQDPACTNAPFSAVWETGEAFAFVDVGQGNVATFACIMATGFTGGSLGPITSNSIVSNGCFAVQGLGTSVVSVFLETPNNTACPVVTSIRVGTSQVATPTATSTAATATPTRTATPAAATATPTGTATAAPTTSPATPTRVPPTAPRTGSGADDGGSGGATPILFALIALGGLAAVGASFRYAANRR